MSTDRSSRQPPYTFPSLFPTFLLHHTRGSKESERECILFKFKEITHGLRRVERVKVADTHAFLSFSQAIVLKRPLLPRCQMKVLLISAEK